jgi:lipoprotein-anchoring transpeptidase ErfK/SrfK
MSVRKLLIVLVVLLAASLLWVQQRAEAPRPIPRDAPRSAEATVYWEAEDSLPPPEELTPADTATLAALALRDSVPSAPDVARAAALALVPLPVGRGDSGDPVLYVQILLDRARFSPGAIDARWGKNTQSAVEWFQRAEELPETGVVDSLTLERLYDRAGGPEAFVTTIALTEEDLAGPFVQIPADVYRQDDLRCLCYRSPLEAFTERFHALPEILSLLNPAVDFDRLAAGDSLRVPAVAWSPPDSAPEVARIVISDAGHWLHALDADGRVLHHFPTTLGSRYDPSPSGEYHVTRVTEEPWFHYQPRLLAGVDDDLPPTRLPPGPNSPVGLVWIALSKQHYGIHGTSEPATIGYATSSGCVRLTNWDAVFLSRRIRTEIPVEFRDVAAEAAPADTTPPAGAAPPSGTPPGGEPGAGSR